MLTYQISTQLKGKEKESINGLTVMQAIQVKRLLDRLKVEHSVKRYERRNNILHVQGFGIID